MFADSSVVVYEMNISVITASHIQKCSSDNLVFNDVYILRES